MSPDETMDVDEQVECLNRALRLQHRSVLLYSLTAGSVIGLEHMIMRKQEQVDYLLRARRRP
jgi:hypothetical protein